MSQRWPRWEWRNKSQITKGRRTRASSLQGLIIGPNMGAEDFGRVLVASTPACRPELIRALIKEACAVIWSRRLGTVLRRSV